MNKHQITGRTRAAKGKVKEVAGKVTGNKRKEYEGTAEKLAGKAEAGYGDIKSDARKVTK